MQDKQGLAARHRITYADIQEHPHSQIDGVAFALATRPEQHARVRDR